MNRATRRAEAREAARTVRHRARIRPQERLAPEQIRDLALCHLENLDQIATGNADAGTLWQWVGGILTWSKAAELTGAGAPEMTAQLELANDVIDRYRRTGRVIFTGPEYESAKDGVGFMDQIAELVPKRKASEAAGWSERRVNEMAKPSSLQETGR